VAQSRSYNSNRRNDANPENAPERFRMLPVICFVEMIVDPLAGRRAGGLLGGGGDWEPDRECRAGRDAAAFAQTAECIKDSPEKFNPSVHLVLDLRYRVRD